METIIYITNVILEFIQSIASFIQTTTVQSILCTILIILLAAYNGSFINLLNSTEQKDKDKYQKQFHIIGFIIRGIVLFLLFGNWIWFFIALNFSWTGYDMIIAKWMKQGVFYVGKTSSMDKLFGYLGFIGKGLLLIGSVLILVLNKKKEK